MWDSEMVILLRHLIDDVDEPVKYTDERLMRLILVAGQYTQTENVFLQKYSISVDNLTLRPDPTDAQLLRDDAFVNLTVLKAACILASGGLLKGSSSNISVREVSYQFDGRHKFEGKKFASQNWCENYSNAKWEYSLNGREAGIAIIGPYRSLMNTDGMGR